MLTRLIRALGTVALSMTLFAACGGDDGVTVGECPPDATQQQKDLGADLIRFSCNDFCHASDRVGEDRAGAPEGMTFDTPEQTFQFADEIYGSVLRTVNPMPPGGSMRADQIEAIRVYLSCGIADQAAAQ